MHEYLLDHELARGVHVDDCPELFEDPAQPAGPVAIAGAHEPARDVNETYSVGIDDAVSGGPGAWVDADDAYRAQPSSARISSEISTLEYTCCTSSTSSSISINLMICRAFSASRETFVDGRIVTSACSGSRPPATTLS